MRDFKTSLRCLIGMMRPHRWQIAASCAIGICRIALSLGFVWICKALVDIATGVSSADLRLHIAIMLGIILMQLVEGVTESWWNGYVTLKSQNKLRASIFDHVMKVQWKGREAFHSADMINRLEEDVRVVVELICTRVPDVIVTICQLIAASIFLFTLESSLLWVLLILMPVAVLGSKLFFKQIRKLTSMVRAKDSEIQGHMQENLQHRMLVLTLGCTERVLEKMGWLQEDLEDFTIKRLNYNAIARGFMRLGFLAGYAAAFLWGILGIKSGAVTFGMMTAFLQLVGQVQRPIAEIGRHIPAFIHALTSVDRISEMTDLPLEPEGEKKFLKGAPGIKIEGLTFIYADGTEEVLSDFSYDFKPGGITAIMGLTGAGKSTLTRLILGLLKPTSGQIRLYNDEESVPADVNTRCNFMYVPQGNSLMTGTIRDNLLLANPNATEQQMIDALHTAVADFVLTLPHGLDTICSEKGGGLSEGQAQRIAIARALLHEGGILILDEATSALDMETEKTLLERMNKSLDGERTILWITHREAVTSIATGILKI